MAITITTADVKRKAMITTSDYDSSISALIAEMQPALEYSIADPYLAATLDEKLQATLKLGMLEIIAGEFLEQLRREVGASEQFGVAGLSMGSANQTGIELVQQGATRLAPYLKSVLPMISENSPATTSNGETVFSLEEEVW
ncbi:MAG: hypothetical protein N3B12_05200 [Armatimonadetes bacterium]|nr:hypothetical protein [Armatimonadota bacterium]